MMYHLDQKWFLLCKEQSDLGQGRLYDLGIRALKNQHKRFKDSNLHLAPIYSPGYEPNPFYHQYDLLIHIWIHYKQLMKEEVKILRKEKKDDLADEILQTGTLYGITRTDILFAAGELRWPTTIQSTGARYGKLIRDPWSERRGVAFSDLKRDNVISFGGSGQGKTTVFLGFLLMIWDHYMFTEKGARCMISTVNKDKLNAVPWSYLCALNRSTEKGISVHAGRGEVKGEWTIKRPGNKDDGGVFKGLLLGKQIKESTIVDKLTGSHGHPFIGYILDEAQSTSDAPLTASSNFTQTSNMSKVILCGNYDEDYDTLGSNSQPINGWGSVDRHTGQWISQMQTGNEAIVLHFNNEDSPGMDPELCKVFPHLPNQAKLEKNTPLPHQRSLTYVSYRRFWVGYREENKSGDTVMTDEIIRQSGADQQLMFSKITKNVFSFDSAPAEIDRNILMLGRFGYDSIHDHEKIFGPYAIKTLAKATESTTYYTESTAEILKIIKEHRIPSGGGILDWTGRPAHAENLQAQGFRVHKMIYNKSIPDGIKIDRHTKKKEKAWMLNVQLGHRSDEIPADKTGAHHVAENMISFAAWLCQQYILSGRLRGINQYLIDQAQPNRGMELEFYARKFKYKESGTWGKRFQLISKDEFKAKHQFSPDIQDTLFQLCLYAYLYENVPLTPIGQGDTVPTSHHESDEEDMKSDFDSHQELWDMDGLYDLNQF